MSEYSEYQDRAARGGHKKPGPGAHNANGSSSGCMVVAPVPALVLAGLALVWKVARR
ncbi:MAG TPA: hypothetical protein VFH77_15620 [Streptomyces sp.]|nr:hypothetical protein [Streptomyces sp.]